MNLEALKLAVRSIGSRFSDREERARRIFLTERPASMHHQQDREFAIRTQISRYFKIAYSSVAFCGSGQLGFSAHKNKLFEPGTSDLDVACIDVDLFQRAWMDVVSSTRSFTDLSAFGQGGQSSVNVLREQIVRRGMIRVDAMPRSRLRQDWSAFQRDISRSHTDLYQKITIAIYMNEFAFCWKQDSALTHIMRD